jgi:hypothetical protein
MAMFRPDAGAVQFLAELTKRRDAVVVYSAMTYI